MMAGVVGALWGMVVLLLLVAAFGVANTLTMNVLEQTRELGLLRIIAMTRDQVRKTIFAQALMIGLLALIPGIIAGFGIAYLINLATLPVIGHPVEAAVPPLADVRRLRHRHRRSRRRRLVPRRTRRPPQALRSPPLRLSSVTSQI